MRTFITIILAVVSLTMISCSQSDEVLVGTPAYAYNNNNESNTRTQFNDSAYVRIGMFSSLEGYNIKIENVKFMSASPDVKLPTFGTNFTTVESLPTTADSAIFDTQSATFHGAVPTTEVQMVIVQFDVVMTAAEGFEYSQRFNGMKAYITPDNATWSEGAHYEYIINVDANFLNLSSIEFNATVEGFQGA